MFSSICYSNKIVVYWDLPENYIKGNSYVVIVDGQKVAETEKCHIEVCDLEPQKNYTFEVIMKGTSEEEVGKATFTTEPVRRRIDITKSPYNAIGDGKTLNTEKIQKAIDDCGEGECVYVPAGDYMTGSLFLHSHMELYIEKGANLHGTCEVKDYSPKIKSRFEGYEMMCYASVLNIGELARDKGCTCEDVRIVGEGTVSSGGKILADNVIEVEQKLIKDTNEDLYNKIKESKDPQTIPGRARPRLINVSCAKDIVISGITVKEGSSWNIHMIYSDNIATYGCTFLSQGVRNGDGWDPDSSTNCTIFGCEFFTGDDSVAIKSGKNPEGNIINKPCEHIRVFDCVSHMGHGFNIGSEISGGINDVRIWNCDVEKSFFGIEIKGTKKRGGYVRNVRVRHCKASLLLMHSVGYNDDGEGAPTPPVFEDCSFENISVTGCMHTTKNEDIYCQAIDIAGFDVPGHFLKNIKFKNIVIDNHIDSRQQSIYLQCCEGVTFENISCK